MREIKFRQRIKGRDGKKDWWHYWGYGVHGGVVFTGPINPVYPEKCPTYEYTGLKDKHDKEIWEGDIVWCKLNRGHNGGNYAVTWSKNCAHWKVYATELYQARDIKVIGNTEENPELLEANNDNGGI